MATNQKFGPEANHAIEVNAGGAVSANDLVKVGDLVGVAQDDSDSNNHVTLYTAGIFNLSVNGKTTGGATKASHTIGSGADGQVTLEVDSAGADGNNWGIEIVDTQSANQDLAVDVDGRDIILTLGTGAGSDLDDTKNTATLVAAALNDKLGGLVTSTASGDGSSPIIAQSGSDDDSVAEASFSGGTDASDINQSVDNFDALYYDGTDLRPDSTHGPQAGFAYDPDETAGTSLVSGGSTDNIWVILDR